MVKVLLIVEAKENYIELFKDIKKIHYTDAKGQQLEVICNKERESEYLFG
jgi:hypothetical protein